MYVNALVSILVEHIFFIVSLFFFVEQRLVLSRCNLIHSRVLRLRWNFLFQNQKRQNQMNEKEVSWNMLLYTLVALLSDTALNTRSFSHSK